MSSTHILRRKSHFILSFSLHAIAFDILSREISSITSNFKRYVNSTSPDSSKTCLPCFQTEGAIYSLRLVMDVAENPYIALISNK